ncbi:hypothetical protein [Sagittula sp. MA-2]|jgi:hypothetical protein|uniref:hypothetical protein n=1 Tax=Sagittula sp. MA-2 TaxID=3048007 RepID=UPI0024C37730|nr:hypothetical protein [Sagittula sp. MA-2]WHZ36283.1 hypothetical protein QNI11_04555 [Sagittula sp. MA-2]
MASSFCHAVVAAIGLGILPASEALADWSVLGERDGMGQGAQGCTTIGGAQACLVLRCDGDGLGWAMSLPEMPEDGDLGVSLEIGGGTYSLDMTISGAVASTGFVARRDDDLVEALGRGVLATVGLDRGRIASFPLPLKGSSRALAQAESLCRDSGEDKAEEDRPVPGQPSDRFVPMFGGEASSEDLSRAAVLLADQLEVIGPDGILSVTLLPVSEDTALLAIETGPSTELYGPSGSAITLAIVEDGAAWQIAQQVGTMIWADTANTTDGWPDLWMQQVGGVDMPFGLWRWTGAGYAHVKNVDP